MLETSDPEIEKPVFRQEGFDGIKPFGEIDGSLGAYVHCKPAARPLSRIDPIKIAAKRPPDAKPDWRRVEGAMNDGGPPGS